MDGEKSAGDAQASDPLYDWLFDALPALFGAPGEHRQTAARTTAEAATASVTGRASQALGLTQQLFNTLYTGYFGALIGQPAGAPLAAFEALLRGHLDQLGNQWRRMGKALAGPAEIEAALGGLTGGTLRSIAGLMKPVSANIERAYGGLADAFGLAPVREFESAVRDLALAVLAQRRAQATYLDVALDAAHLGVAALIARLGEMSARGESIDTMLALMRLCAKTMDGAMHEAMQSPRALQASAEAIRAGLRARQQQQRIVAIASEALNVPTRAEVDEAFREIQALKRELRHLRKNAAPAPEQALALAPMPKARKAPAARARAGAADAARTLRKAQR